jgi:AcrR family transcriptional regulator
MHRRRLPVPGMSPRKADPAVRAALVERAAELLANGEPLSTRRLAAEVGTSPMAVYTHFGSMDDLRREVRGEGFVRLAGRLAAVARTRDPVADLYVLGWEYARFALENPHLYRVMFVEAVPGADAGSKGVGWEALTQLLDTVQRGRGAGRFAGEDAWPQALHAWAMAHGLVMISFTGVFSAEQVLGQVPTMARDLFLGFGDSEAAARRSIRNARRRIDRDPAAVLPPAPVRSPSVAPVEATGAR